MAYTIADIYSHFKSKGKDAKIYARKGEKVTIIEIRGNVTIVQGKTEKFPIKNEDLT
jgi:hypothetical protein